MELAIIHKGEVFQVEAGLETYDLDKPFARAEIIDAIKHEVKRIQRYETA